MANAEHSPPVGALIAEMREGLKDATPGPWSAFLSVDKGWMVIGVCADVQPEDAAHIARCSPDKIAALLDSHAALVEALDLSERALISGFDPDKQAALAAIRDALRLAKEGQPS